MTRQMLCLVAVFLVLAGYVCALETYIDEEIVLLENGEATVTGTTNIDVLEYIKPADLKIEGTTPELTKKKDRYWLFEYNSEENVTTSVIKLSLPKGAVVNHIRTGMKISISSEEDITTITFIGNSQPVDILLQYYMQGQIQPGNKDEKVFPLWTAVFAGAGLILAAAIAALAYLYIKARKAMHNGKKYRQKQEDNGIAASAIGKGAEEQIMPEHGKMHEKDSRVMHGERELDTEKLKGIKLALNDTQLRIIDALLGTVGESSQTKLQYSTGIPKASLSRNLELLSQKEIVQKIYSGTSNYIRLHPSLYK